ncbi:Flp pilus assembly protein CpaB [candidate division CSSED10-310 bacterium]|uniref:Flp pilus assembly protein CpaB n=1 Tax=candidate division CSSED10-310 bacterium TaxID=2855610 RepID=A0ABV6YX74_UNCC1
MKGKGAFAISMILGLIAVFAVFAYIKRERNKIFEDTKAVRVLTAKDDILEMERLDESMVVYQEVPAKFVQPKALFSVEEVVGQVTSVPIFKGEQVLATKLVAFGWDTGLAMKVPPGMRALSVPVTDVTGVAGLIRPGNFVDLYGTFKVKSKNRSDVFEATRIILQKVRVLSVERTMGALTRDKERQEDGETMKGVKTDMGLGKKKEYPKNITIAVTPSQASKVITAVAAGLVYAALRSRYETEEEVIVEPIDVRDLIGKENVVPAKRRPDWIEIRGSERTFD